MDDESESTKSSHCRYSSIDSKDQENIGSPQIARSTEKIGKTFDNAPISPTNETNR